MKIGDGRKGDHEVDCGHRDDVVLVMEADVEVNQDIDKEVANIANAKVFSCQKSLKVHMVTTYWRLKFVLNF